MYAIVEHQGFQYRVTPDQVVRISKTPGDPGTTLTLDRVLFVHDGQTAKVGTPVVENAAVQAEVVGQGRGKKIVVGKFRRRKDYRRKKGHRQDYTEIRIRSIRG